MKAGSSCGSGAVMQAETERPTRDSGDQKERSGFIGECHVAVYTDEQ